MAAEASSGVGMGRCWTGWGGVRGARHDDGVVTYH